MSWLERCDVSAMLAARVSGCIAVGVGGRNDAGNKRQENASSEMAMVVVVDLTEKRFGKARRHSPFAVCVKKDVPIVFSVFMGLVASIGMFFDLHPIMVAVVILVFVS